MEPLGLDFGPPGEVNTLIFAATVVKNQGFRGFLKGFKKDTQKAPKGDPRGAKMPPRSAPGAPRSGPRGAKTGPGAAKSDPGAPREPPKRRTKGARKASVIDSARGVAPGASWEPSWSDFGSDFGASGVAFWSQFREISLCLKRSVEPARARGVPSDTPPRR